MTFFLRVPQNKLFLQCKKSHLIPRKMKGMFDLFMDETFHCKWYCTCSESLNKEIFLKNCLKSILYSQTSVSQGHTDILAGNSGYSLYSPGSGEVQAVACTEHGKHKCNIVHFLYICST